MPGVIKEAELRSAERFSFKDFERAGQEVLNRAKAQAAELLRAARARAESEAQSARETAYAEGLAEGRAEGERQIRAEITSQVKQETSNEVQTSVALLVQSLNAVEQSKFRLIAQAEQGLLNVAISIAERICKYLPELDEQAAIENCRQTLLAVGRHGDLELNVHPADHELIQKWAKDFVAKTDRLQTVSVIVDDSVDRGGCVVRGRDVSIDATIATQLERIARTLLGHPDPADAQS